ncbi:hypothetical protein [Bacillus massiliglaciei]|uniref:hypothetical protein n=1 Tax=Bacillus massiliglaciei TaxID=1816693 RepID=UPI000DA6032D|nr:hypothetical protein [Bacillus massiliglaciei]
MIKNKKLLVLAIFFFVGYMALSFHLFHENIHGDAGLSVLNVLVYTGNGLQVIGMLLVVCLFLLAKSVKKYYAAAVVLTVIAASFGPAMAVSAFQKTIAADIYAVSYKSNSSKCNFEKTDEATLHGECELPFENYSSDDVPFTLEFYENFQGEDGEPMVSLLNRNGPYQVKLSGHERKTVRIESDIDVSNIENPIESGSVSYVNIRIKHGTKERNLWR